MFSMFLEGERKVGYFFGGDNPCLPSFSFKDIRRLNEQVLFEAFVFAVINTVA
jgi:hypothetical protein